MKALLGAVLVGLLGLAAAVLVRRLTRRGKVRVEAGAGRTRMSPVVLLLCLLCAAAAAGFLALGLFLADGDLAAFQSALAAACASSGACQ